VVVSLPCTNLGSAAKRLKESDMVVTHPGNSFGGSDFENTKTTGMMISVFLSLDVQGFLILMVCKTLAFFKIYLASRSSPCKPKKLKRLQVIRCDERHCGTKSGSTQFSLSSFSVHTSLKSSAC